MACIRGAASPNAHTQKRLFAASAGFCQNPKCGRELFLDVEGTSVHVAEMAHIFSAADCGPRAKPELTEEERGSFNNLILLCANCHTIVDKAPDAFPDKMILAWKAAHAQKLRNVFGAAKLADRDSVREAIEPIFSENKAIFEAFGPHIEAACDPESGAAEKWQRKVLVKIIPNNHRMMALLDANRHHLNDDEKETAEKFRQHLDDLEAYHIQGLREDATQFPTEMADMLKDGEK